MYLFLNEETKIILKFKICIYLPIHKKQIPKHHDQ